MFQLGGETRLRAISFDAQANGVLPIEVNAAWSQAPYGFPVIVGTTAYSYGQSLGRVPWEPGQFTWSSDGRFMCAVLPERAASGSPLRLEVAFVGQPAKVVTSGFGSFGDNSSQRVLTCDETTDRVIVGVFGQGFYATRLWIFKLSTGALLRSVDYGTGAAGRWLAASPDGSLLAEAERPTAGSPWTSKVRRTDDGAELANFDDLLVRGFSGDNTLVVGESGGVTIVEWKANRKVWSTAGVYGGHLPEPAGRRFAVGVGFLGGGDQCDLHLIDADGKAVLLPTIAVFAPRY